ncbi:MAG: FG-GAP-like repeat-containing protein, partial [Pirellulales bacterium]
MRWLRMLPARRREILIRERRRRFRHCFIEHLEERRVMDADAWHNVLQPLNVSGERQQFVSPLDALLVINELNTRRYTDSQSGIFKPGENTDHFFFDVTCDSFVTPLDALYVINALNTNQYDNPWQSDFPNDGSDAASGRIVSSSCSPRIVEGNSLAPELNRSFVLPDNSSAVRVVFETPNFDSTAQDKLRDAFEITVESAAQSNITLPFRSRVEASLNWSESLSPLAGPGVQLNRDTGNGRTTAVFNLNGVAGGTAITVSARLVNNDGDTNSSVIVRSIDVIDSPSPSPTGLVPSDPNPFPSGRPTTEQLNPTSLLDVTGSVRPVYTSTTLVESTGSLISDVAVKNVDTNGLGGRIIVAVDSISDPTVTVQSPDGYLAGGRPYFLMTAENGEEWLAPSTISTSRRIQFLNPDRVPFTYTLTALGKVNLPPVPFEPVSVTGIEAGRRYSTRVATSDPDGQSLVYRLKTHPSGMVIDSDTGELQWQTSAGDIGNHSVTVVATDPFGLSVERSFQLQVFESLPNRPPIITAAPSTEATVAGSYEILTLPGGDGVAAVSAAQVGSSMRVVTANAITSDLSLISRTGMSSVNLGQPPLPVRGLQAGIDVEIGLPDFTHPNDRQQLEWLTQGDFNGDGFPDLATVDFVLSTGTGAQERERFVAVSLGNGDGTFGSPTKLPIRSTTNDGDDDYRPVSSLLAQDFDRDGSVDLAAVTWVTNGSTPRNGLLFWKGLGDGRFEALRVQDPGLAIQKIEPADVNSDGTLDLVATTNGLDRVGVLIGRSDGTFENFREILYRPGANYSLPFSFADIDGDGRVDIAMVSAGDRRVQVMRNDTTGNFQLIVNREVPDSDPLGVYAADFDGDAHEDLVVLTRQGSEGGGMLIYRGTDDPWQFLSPTEAAKGQPISPINFSTDAKPMDLDGDGDLDLTWGHFEGRSGVTVAFNRGNGTFALENYLNAAAPSAAARNETNEWHVIPSDLNRDGLIDLMVSSTSSSSNQVLVGVTVMQAVAQGKYAAPRRQKFDTTGGIAPFTGINYASDFNNDGNVDLLGVVFQNGMRISFGNGDGTFQASVPASSGVGNEFYASGFQADFNRDGFEDALWLGTGGVQGGPGARVLIGFNDGNGAFSIASYSNPQGDYGYLTSVVSGDFNNDGFVDFAGRGDGYTDVWLYAGNNSFTRAVRLAAPLGENTNVLSAGDFNLDGRVDILIGSGRANDRPYGQLTTYLGNGDGSFQSGLTQDFFKSNSDVWAPKWSAVGDINEDGIPDLAISSAYSRTTLLIGRGDGLFEDETEYVSGSYFAFGRNIYLRDIDHDTHLDLLEVDDNQGRSALRIRYGAGDGTFSEPESYGMPGGVPYLDFADVNEDGAEDVISGTQGAGFDTSTIFLGRIPSVNGVAAADINGDSRDDLISLSSDLSRIHIQTSLTGDKFFKQPDLVVGSRPVALVLGDLNADGRTDLVTANDLGKSLSLLKANIAGGFTREDILLGHRLSDVAIGRLNNDAYPDLVTISEDSRTVIVLAGSTTGFSVVDTMALSTWPEHLALGDVTGDGLTDAIVTLPDAKQIMILPGDGSGHWSAPKFVNVSSRPGPLRTADLNADGTADIIVTLPDEDRIALVMARNGRFSSPQKLHVGAQPSSIAVIDWNNDGRPDFVVGNSSDNTVSVVINHYDPTQVYSSKVVAVDPDGDPITYELVQAPDGMLLDPITGQFLWAPVAEQIGVQNVVVRVSDNRGGEAVQGFPIQVTSPITNHAPVIFSVPPESIVADQPFVTTVSGNDADGDALRYRLLSGPSSAQLDPVSGELHWDPRADAVEINTWTYQQGSIVVPFTSTLQTPSITIEGIYRLNRLDLSQTFFRKFSYMPYPFGIDTLELRYQSEGSLLVSVSDGSRNDYQYVAWRPEADRWYHLAVTFDDSSRTMRLLVDGTVILATQLDHGLQYDGNPLSIGSGFNDRMIGSVASFRMWNVARTAAQIRDDWARQLAPDTTGLTLDYRFDSADALTIHDYSQFNNDGRRVTQSGPM